MNPNTPTNILEGSISEPTIQVNASEIWNGSDATIPVKIISDVPFPIPLIVI
jgi:hypothetical protein